MHTHTNEHGALVKCYHECKNMLFSVSFWVGLTMGFPLEHWLWEKLWPFTVLTELLGL